jgi:hypothetical protein
MNLMEQYQQVEARMEESFRKNRFDTFSQLMSERLRILRVTANAPDREHMLAQAKQRTEQWVTRLSDLIQKERLRWKQAQSLAGYRTSSRSGRVINKRY